MTLRLLIATALGPAMLLGGCASAGGDYPSLARRSAERITGSGQPVAPETPVPPPPPVAGDLDTRLARIASAARRAHADFEAQRSRTQALVAAARGAERGSEAWTDAHVALAGLQAARSGAMVALADLDDLHAAERLAWPDAVSPSAQMVADVRDEIELWVSEEDLVIDRLAKSLG